MAEGVSHNKQYLSLLISKVLGQKLPGLDRLNREGGGVLDPVEPLLLDEGDEATVSDEAGG